MAEMSGVFKAVLSTKFQQCSTLHSSEKKKAVWLNLLKKRKKKKKSLGSYGRMKQEKAFTITEQILFI